MSTATEQLTTVSAPGLIGEACSLCGSPSTSEFLTAPDRFHGRSAKYTLNRCASCSLVWLQDPPLPEDMGQHYGPDYDRAVALAGDSPERWRGRVQVLNEMKPEGGSLLDLGCSSGGFLEAVRSPRWTLCGIEMSQPVAQRAESRSGATVFVGDILDAPYPAGSFDAITCFHVFEHLYEPVRVLERVSEWLRPGGVFYLMVPNIESVGARVFRSYWYALELPRHLYHFSPRSLTHLAQAVGLETVSVTANRELFVEKSAGYWIDDLMRKCGRPRLPLASRPQPGVAFRAVRKAFRLTAIPALNGVAALFGDGESIHAIFTKSA